MLENVACSVPETVPQVVEHPAATALLLDPEARRVLLPFFGRGASISEAAEWLGEPLNRVLKQVYKLQRYRLLKVLEVAGRSGRPIKRYGVTNPRFFVPFQATNAITLEDLLLRAVEEPNRVVAQALPRLVEAQNRQLGYLIRLQEDGRIAHGLTVDGIHELCPEDLPRAWGRNGHVLFLSDEQARAFLHEQQALIEKYAGGSGEPYLAFYAFGPILSDPCAVVPPAQNGES